MIINSYLFYKMYNITRQIRTSFFRSADKLFIRASSTTTTVDPMKSIVAGKAPIKVDVETGKY